MGALITIISAGSLKLITFSQQKIRYIYKDLLFRNAIYLILNSVITSISGFVFWIIAARLYSPESVGFASATISAIILLALISQFGLNDGLTRFLPSYGDKASELISSCLTLVVLISLGIAVIFIAGINIWSPVLSPILQQPVLLVSFVVITVTQAVFFLSQQLFMAKRRAIFTLLQGLIASVFKIVLLVILAILFSGISIFISWGAALLLAVLAFFLFLSFNSTLNNNIRPSINRDAVKKIIGFSLNNYLSSILLSAPAQILPLMIINILGAEKNAYFYIAWSLSNFLTVVVTAVSSSLFVEGSHDGLRTIKPIKQSFKLIFVFIIPLILAFILLGDKLLDLFGNRYSENATNLLRLLAFSSLPLSVNFIYVSIMRVQMNVQKITILSGFILLLTLGLSYLLIPLHGINGVGIAWLIAQSTAAIIIIWIIRNNGKNTVISHNVTENKIV